MATFIKLEEARRIVANPRGFASWALGFRPFHLLASRFAAVSIALWALQCAGLLGHAYLSGPIWHAHQMPFGFALAVVVGFLFTAGRNWSGQPTPTGKPLVAPAVLWRSGRIPVLNPFAGAAALTDVALALAATTMHAVACAALLGSAGFGLHAARYWQVLIRPRLDGRPG